MKNLNLLQFVLRAATALAVLTLSAALFVSSSPPAWGSELAPYQADFASLQAYSFAAITNTSSAANTITIDFWDKDSVAECGQSKPPICSISYSVAPGATWILSSSSGLSTNKKTGATGFTGVACISDTAGDKFDYYPAVAFPVSPGEGAPLALSGFAMTPVSITSCANCGASITFIDVEKKGKHAAYSGHPGDIIDHVTWKKETFPPSINKIDKEIATALVYELNKRHVEDKDVIREGTTILKTNPIIRQLIKDRARLHKEIAGQSKAPDTVGKAKSKRHGGGEAALPGTSKRKPDRKSSKKPDEGQGSPAKTVIELGGCRFTQPTLSNYRKGLSGMPNDIPKPPSSVFGGYYDHGTGKSFHIGSGESASSLKSWYRKQLPGKGWSILKDDTLDTRFGPFQRLFAKSKKACMSIVISNAPAGPNKSVVAIYTYPGPD